MVPEETGAITENVEGQPINPESTTAVVAKPAKKKGSKSKNV